MKTSYIVGFIAIAILIIFAVYYIMGTTPQSSTVPTPTSTAEISPTVSPSSSLNPSSDVTPAPSTTSTPAPQVGFSEIGNLAKNNPGFKPGYWYFVYEKPGAPALNVELKFTPDSICVANGVSDFCSKGGFSAGDRVRVQGIKTDSVVVVERIEKQ